MDGPIQVAAWDAERPPDPALIADCVHCGFCLPTCPTYSLWDEEADSPRGRIVLMDAGHSSGLSAPMVEHLDNCLGCMACVTACPSGVRYDRLIEDTRGQVERHWHRAAPDRALRRLLFALLPHPGRLRAMVPLLATARALRLDRLIARAPFPRLAALARLAPPAGGRASLPARIPARGEPRGTVALLQGCVQRVFFGQVNRATADVLSGEGFDVAAPPEPRCCGALQLHAGESEAARALARATIAALESYDHVAVNAAGCGSAMKEYGHLLRDDPEWAHRAETFSGRVQDVTELLAAAPPRAKRTRVPMRVVYHDACHLAHAQGVRQQPRELLRQIPGVELVEPADWEICCGSAGIYNFVKPEPAAALGRRKAESLLATGADAVVAANPGCAVQIAAHARELGRPIEVLHPMELLARSLELG
jgi:glycolate oxidase iron-sulfur subunit